MLGIFGNISYICKKKKKDIMTELIIISGSSASLLEVVTGIAIAVVCLLMWRGPWKRQGRKASTLDEIRQEQRRASDYLAKFITGTGKPYELKKVIFTGREYTAFVKHTGMFSNTFYVKGKTLFEVSERLSERFFR